MDKLVIGFDLDGVLIDHTENKLRVVTERGWCITLAQTPSDVLQVLLPHDVWHEVKIILYDEPKISLTPPLMAETDTCLERLTRAGIKYFLISCRRHPENAIALMQQRGLWPKYFDHKNAYFVEKPQDKNEKARLCGITHYLDDELSVLERLVDVPHRFHLDQFSIASTSSFERVTSLPQFIDCVLGATSEA